MSMACDGGGDDNETGNNKNGLQDKNMKISKLVQSQMTQRLGQHQEQVVRLFENFVH
jgi:hypothetical protein